MNNDSDLFIIGPESAGQRLDKALTTHFSDVRSRNYFHQLIARGQVLVNGEAVKKRTLMVEGDEIEVNFVCDKALTLEPENIPLDIVYEDDDLLVINKPTGMVVHPGAGNWSQTFVNALLYHCNRESVTSENVRPGIVHRLDKDTSGLLIAAKNEPTQQLLAALFADRKIYKEYLAICYGQVGQVTIDLPIGRHPINRKKMAVLDSGGKRAVSICRQIDGTSKLSLVAVELVTGRTHQIRVHLQHNNTPIVGDPLYGTSKINKLYDVDTQMLHAHILRFVHPITGKPMEFKAPPPATMAQLMAKEGLCCPEDRLSGNNVHPSPQ
jgi:23S rRNA pseudouridine1911/1915/1917 synthase